MFDNTKAVLCYVLGFGAAMAVVMAYIVLCVYLAGGPNNDVGVISYMFGIPVVGSIIGATIIDLCKWWKARKG